MIKCVISGYYGFRNFGDEAILAVLVKHLKDINADVTVLSSDCEFTSRTYSVCSVKRFDIKNVINVIKSSDVLISGGGSLLQDATSIKSLIYYSFIIALGLFFNKKVIIFAQGIGPLYSFISKIIVKNVLKYCTLVTVRDEISLSLLKNWNINAKLVCDPVYSLGVKANNKQGIVGIQLRDFKTVNDNLLYKLALFVVDKFSDSKIEILSLQNSQDYDLSKKFENIILSINPDINVSVIEDNIIEHISSLEYLIAMRFHALLIAIKCGVKTCAVNYDVKVQKLAMSANIPIISMDAHENFEEIYDRLTKLNRNSLLNFAKKQKFDWSEFDNLLFCAK